MKKKILIASIALFSLIAAGAGTGIALADTTDDTAPAKVKNWFGQKWNNLTEEEKADLKEKMEERKAEAQTRQAAIKAALEAGDYDAWLAAVGSDCPLAEKITKENFSSYVEAYNLMTQAREKLEGLGLNGGMMGSGAHWFGLGLQRGKGMGSGMGQGRGMGFGFGFDAQTESN